MIMISMKKDLAQIQSLLTTGFLKLSLIGLLRFLYPLESPPLAPAAISAFVSSSVSVLMIVGLISVRSIGTSCRKLRSRYPLLPTMRTLSTVLTTQESHFCELKSCHIVNFQPKSFTLHLLNVLLVCILSIYEVCFQM